MHEPRLPAWILAASHELRQARSRAAGPGLLQRLGWPPLMTTELAGGGDNRHPCAPPCLVPGRVQLVGPHGRVNGRVVAVAVHENPSASEDVELVHHPGSFTAPSPPSGKPGFQATSHRCPSRSRKNPEYPPQGISRPRLEIRAPAASASASTASAWSFERVL